MQAPRYTYRNVTHLVTNPTGQHVNVYSSDHDGRIAEMWSDRLGNWYSACWLGDHGSTRGIRGGMTAGQVIEYTERHARQFHKPDHECDSAIRLSVPVKMAGAVTGYTDMTECSQCGKRRMVGRES